MYHRVRSDEVHICARQSEVAFCRIWEDVVSRGDEVQSKGHEKILFIQSCQADPFRHFELSGYRAPFAFKNPWKNSRIEREGKLKFRPCPCHEWNERAFCSRDNVATKLGLSGIQHVIRDRRDKIPRRIITCQPGMVLSLESICMNGRHLSQRAIDGPLVRIPISLPV